MSDRMIKVLAYLVCVCFVFAACGNSQTNTPTDPQKTALEIYYLSEDASATHIVSSYKRGASDITVNATAFSNIEEMDLRLSTELNGGNGPDVILFPSSTTLDTTKMAMNGTFMDLSGMLASDETYDASNYYPVLDAGVMEGKQGLMPLRFKLQYLMSTNEKLERVGISKEDMLTAPKLMEAMIAHGAQCEADYSAVQYLNATTIGGLLYNTLRLTNIQVVDYSNASASVSEEVFKEYAAYAQMNYTHLIRSQEILQLYSRDFIGAMERLTTLVSNESFFYQWRYYTALYDQGMGEIFCPITIPNYDNADALTADICLYAAIPQSTDQPQAAYDFVRFAMDSSVSDATHDLSVSRKVAKTMLNDLYTNPGKKVNIGSMYVQVPTMSNDLRTMCEETLERIASGNIRNGVIDSIFTETMGDYITGKAEFDTCYEKFLNQVNLYLYE